MSLEGLNLYICMVSLMLNDNVKYEHDLLTTMRIQSAI